VHDGIAQVIITRIITSKGNIRSLGQALREVLETSGAGGMYRGVSAYVRPGAFPPVDCSSIRIKTGRQLPFPTFEGAHGPAASRS
jgi:hypothetical protein